MLPDLISTALRALGFVAILQAGGAVLFLAAFGGPLERARPGIREVARAAVRVAAGLLILQYLLEPARMLGELSGVLDAQLQGIALHSRAAVVLALRLLGLLLLGLGLRNGAAAVRSLGLGGAVLIALSFAAIGHTAESAARVLLMPLLVLHLLVVEFWFGALLPLLLVVGREPAAIAAQVVSRYSRLATWLVPLILIAGTAIAAFLLPDAAALREPYGTGLLLKVLAFVLLMGLAALNKWRLVPALAQGGLVAARRFRRSVAIELALIVVVVMGTATLTNFWSPPS